MKFNAQNLTSKVKFLTTLLLISFLCIQVHAQEKVVLGLTGTVFKEDLKNFLDWEKYLEQQNDFDVEIIFSKTYEEMNLYIKENRVDVAYVCNSSYTDLEKTNTGKLLAVPIVNKEDQYYSYVITREEKSYTSLLDFEDTIFAFTDPQSNSGAIAPQYYLLDNSIDFESFFSSFIYTYEHGDSVKAVHEGFVDGASVDSIVYTRFGEKYPEKIEELKVVQVLGPFANSPIVVRASLSQKIFKALQESFLNMHKDPYGKSILNKLALDRFDAPLNQDYSNVAKMIQALGRKF